MISLFELKLVLYLYTIRARIALLMEHRHAQRTLKTTYYTPPGSLGIARLLARSADPPPPISELERRQRQNSNAIRGQHVW
jgi:hypothetical protein